LAGNPSARTLQQIDIVSHAHLTVLAAPASATAVAETATGVLGLGLASPNGGAVQLRSSATGALLQTVAVSAPVVALAAGTTGAALFVLEATATAANVIVLDSATGHVLRRVPVPLLAVAVTPGPAQTTVWVLQPDGLVDQVGLGNGTLMTQFSIGNSGRALALSPDGSTLYVLKGRGSIRNVAVVDLATESVLRVLPAPLGAVGLVLSPDGSTLYDLVGTAAMGNIQAFRTAARGS
jgi:DNA-binding beta-propeller fold protein YncE